ncbi:MAG: zinc ABC transporter substrate-binding protein [Actinobacteria bacterium]|nr:zinc ABC transporter substrate-binding protein [Actinomycetota bacterium]
MNKRFFVAAGILVAAIVFAGIVFANLSKKGSEEKVAVAASFYTLAEFARQVGGDKVTVKTVTPAGVEPHDFEPSPKDIVSLQKSKVFIYSGTGFEPWADKVLPDLRDVAVVNASKSISLLKAVPEEDEAEKEKAVTDGHFYLDPALAQQVVRNIAEKLGGVDPSGKSFYEKNAGAYIEKLAMLDKEFQEGLKSRRRNEIITSHTAFAYLAKRYNFRQVPIAGLAEEEPSPAKLAEVAKFARDNKVKYVFFETLTSPRLSETVAKEIGAKTLVLNPLEGLTPEEQREGKNYMSVMRENLKNLRVALEGE